jgi:hypothetical protein
MITPSASRGSKYLESYQTTGYGSNVKPGSGSTGKAAGSDTWRYGSPSDIKKARLGSQGGSSRGSGSSSSRRSSTKVIRKGDAPEIPTLPTFKAPEMDKRGVRALTQKLAAPGIRTLRETVQQSMGKNYENPNVRKMTLREALQGYGTGLEKVMSGAGREARSEKMAELDLQRQEEMANFQSQTNAAMQNYQNAWADYLKGSETVTTSGTAVEGSEGEVGGGVEMGGRIYTQKRNPYTGRAVPI